MENKYPKSGYLSLTLALLFFGFPLFSTFDFSLHEEHGYGFAAYTQLFDNPQFASTLWLSFRLAIETIIITLILVVPAAYWAHAKLPRARPVLELLSVLPFVVPPIVLGSALLNVFASSPLLESTWFLVFAYVVIAFPYTYRMLDAGLRAVDLAMLTEAAESLGASRIVTLWRVVLPNIRGAAISACLLTVAVVLGEFAIASEALFITFPVFINELGHDQATVGAALTVLSFAITWLAMAALLFLGGDRARFRRTRVVAVAR